LFFLTEFELNFCGLSHPAFRSSRIFNIRVESSGFLQGENFQDVIFGTFRVKDAFVENHLFECDLSFKKSGGSP